MRAHTACAAISCRWVYGTHAVRIHGIEPRHWAKTHPERPVGRWETSLDCKTELSTVPFGVSKYIIIFAHLDNRCEAGPSGKTSANAAMMTATNAGTRALANVRLDWLQRLRDTLSNITRY